MWTNGWTNYDPQNAVYSATGITVSGEITTNTTWLTGKTYLLQGITYVKNGATLTIQPGVTIRGAAAGSALVSLLQTNQLVKELKVIGEVLSF